MYATGFYTVSIAKKIIALGMTTVFSSTYDTATPAGTDDPSEADDRMREIKAAVQERLAVDHKFSLTGTEVSATDTGEHTKITFNVPLADPTPVASKAHLYMQSDELRYQDDTNSAFDMTSGGKLGSASTDLLAKDAAISGDLDVAGSFDPCTFDTTNGGFLDEDDMASDAADKVASQQSINAFVVNKSIDGTPTAVTTIYLTGTLDADDSTDVAHGLSLANILSVDAMVGDGTDFWLSDVNIDSDTATSANSFTLAVGSTNVTFRNVGANFQGQAYRIEINHK